MHKIALVITVFSFFLQCANIASLGLGPLTQHGAARHGTARRIKEAQSGSFDKSCFEFLDHSVSFFMAHSLSLSLSLYVR